jgi:sortase A
MIVFRDRSSPQRRTCLLAVQNVRRRFSRGMFDMQNTRTAAGGHGSHFLRWVTYLLVIAGGAALGWCAAILTDSYIAQRQAREQLASMPRSMSSPALLPPRSSVMVKAGTPLAELSIPRLGLSAVVLQGSDDHTLRAGPGHIETTPLPGESGNVAIAGHRDSFFRPLRDVQVGDDILLDTPTSRVHYRVASYSVVNSSEVSVLGPTSDNVLTLVTCFPFQFIGSAPDRFVVRANFVTNGKLSPRVDRAPRQTRPRYAQSAQ